MLRPVALAVLFLGYQCHHVLSNRMLVESVVNNTNAFLAANKNDFLPIPDFSDVGPMHELHIRNGKLGNFSSTEVHEPGVVSLTYVKGSKKYAFEAILGLKPAEMSYDFQLSIEGLFPMSGKIRVESRTNSYEVKGIIMRAEDGACHAVLEKCKFKELKNFNVNIQPKSVSYIGQMKKYLLDVVTPHYIPRINRGLNEVITKHEFQHLFSRVMCKSMYDLGL